MHVDVNIPIETLDIQWKLKNMPQTKRFWQTNCTNIFFRILKFISIFLRLFALHHSLSHSKLCICFNFISEWNMCADPSLGIVMCLKSTKIITVTGRLFFYSETFQVYAYGMPIFHRNKAPIFSMASSSYTGEKFPL